MVTFNGRSLENDVTLVGAGVGNEDLLLVYNKASGADMGPGAGTRTVSVVNMLNTRRGRQCS